MLALDRLACPAVSPTRPHPGGGESHPALSHLCWDVADAVGGPLANVERRVAHAIAPYLGAPGLPPEYARQSAPDRYLRHLLYAGPTYTILALVWRPGQMSPVHAHRTWCALGVHHGWMTEAFFSPDAGEPVPRGCIQRPVGDISYGPATPDIAHRMANLGQQTAISIHVYGASFDNLGQHVNQIWADIPPAE